MESINLLEIPIYIRVLTLFDNQEIDLSELEREIEGLSSINDFSKRVINFGVYTGSITDLGNGKVKITNEYNTIEYGIAKITWNYGTQR